MDKKFLPTIVDLWKDIFNDRMDRRIDLVPRFEIIVSLYIDTKDDY